MYSDTSLVTRKLAQTPIWMPAKMTATYRRNVASVFGKDRTVLPAYSAMMKSM